MVATGAGIGAVLPYLLGRSPVQFEFLWIGRCHRAAMGTDLVDRVLAGGPVTLIDTSGGQDFKRIFHAGFHDPDDWLTAPVALGEAGALPHLTEKHLLGEVVERGRRRCSARPRGPAPRWRRAAHRLP